MKLFVKCLIQRQKFEYAYVGPTRATLLVDSQNEFTSCLTNEVYVQVNKKQKMSLAILLFYLVN
jgi:hypothetical protein